MVIGLRGVQFREYIALVISKSDEREPQGRFEITSATTPRIVRKEIQLLISRIYSKF